MKKHLIPILLCIVFLAGQLPAAVYAASYKGASNWAIPELDKAEGYGLITDAVRSNVGSSITRAEFAEIAVRLYEKFTGKKAQAGNVSFKDTSNLEVLKAANMGLVTGVGDGRFAPALLVTREQMAAILLRTLKVINPTKDYSITTTAKFADTKKIASWAYDGVYYCFQNGVIKGGDKNMYSPQGNSSREAAIIVCMRSYELLKQPVGQQTGTGTSSSTSTGSGNNAQSSTVISPKEILVINNSDFAAGKYTLKEEGPDTFIFIPMERFKYAFLYPYSGDYEYPEVNEEDGVITASWKNESQEVFLEVIMEMDSSLALANGQEVDIILGPYRQNGVVMVPVNFFAQVLEMKEEVFSGRRYLQYKEDFPSAVLTGVWSYTNTNLFTGVKDLSTGLVSLPSFDSSYTFNKDGTYHVGMVSSGGMNDMLILQDGKYKVIGNTIIYYNIIETYYKGNPFKLVYKSKLKDAPEYDFIDNYNIDEDKVKIDGIWLYRLK